jgi:hypothetical protein
MNNKLWRKLLRKLRTNFPIDGIVIVKRRKNKKNFGATRFDGRKYSICIDSGSSESCQVDTLLHEWAHVRMIDESFTHSNGWGIQYANIYDSWVKDFGEA